MTLTRPVAGDNFAGTGPGGTPPSTTLLDEYADLLETHDISLAGEPFASTEAFIAQTASLVLDPETTAGFVAVLGAPALDSTNHTVGTKSVKASLRFCWDNNPNLVDRFYVNLSAPAATAGHTKLAMDVLWAYSVGSSGSTLGDHYELVAADGANFTGNIVTSGFNHTSGGVFKTLYVDCSSLTSVASFGLRSFSFSTEDSTLNFVTSIDNIRWLAQTELEAGLSAGAVIAPSDYVPGVTQEVGATAGTVLDLRAANISNLGGVHNARDYQVLDEVGATDSTDALDRMFSQLVTEETLEFPSSACYRIDASAGVKLRGLRNVTIDGRGAQFYQTTLHTSSLFSIVDCIGLTIKNMRVYGAYPDTALGSAFVAVTGSPTVSGSTMQLDAQNEDARSQFIAWFARDKDGEVKFDVTLSDTTHVANDCMIYLKDTNAPTAPTVTPSGTVGSVPPGTRYYALTYTNADGDESGMSPSVAATSATWGIMTLSGIPTPTKGPPVVARNIYRTPAGAADDYANYALVGMIRDNTTTTYVDTFADVSGSEPTEPSLVATNAGAGNIDAGKHAYRISYVTVLKETPYALTHPTTAVLTPTTAATISLAGIPVGPSGTLKRRIYRTKAGMSGEAGNFYFVAEIADNTTTTYSDNASDASLGAVGPGTPTEKFPPYLPRRTYTLTSTPTVVRFVWAAKELLGAKLELHVKKVTATANTISIAQIDHVGRIEYHSANEFNHGFSIGRDCQDITIEDCDIEGVSGDAVTSTDNSAGRITVRRTMSRGSHRQGMSFNGGTGIFLEDLIIRECPRSGIDFEPETTAFAMTDASADRVMFRNVTNYCFSMAAMPRIRTVEISNIRAFGITGAGFLAGGGENLRLTNIIAPWHTASITSRNVTMRDVSLKEIISDAVYVGAWAGWQTSGVAIDGARISADAQPDRPIRIESPKSYVSNVTMTNTTPGATTAGFAGPVHLASDTRWAIIDPGPYATTFPSTYKGVGAGSLWFPRGHDMLDEGLLQTRALSGSTTRGNNLRGIAVAVTAGATTKTVSFPARTYSNPTSYGQAAATRTDGAMAAATYFYRLAGRSGLGGPVLALAEHSVAVVGPNNCVQLTVTGLQKAPFLLEGFTVYRGTATGVYTTRFDVYPNMDWHGIGGAGGDALTTYDIGASINMAAGSANWGYPTSVSPTGTSGHPSWTGTQWTVQDETGWEPDANYALFLEPSWQTSWRISAKRMNGFDVEFGVPCPTGDGTFNWMLVR